MTEPRNLLIVMSDEHNPKMLGCRGHPLARTPSLDRLAREGTVFTAAYTNSPICVPARAAFMTGRHPHETRNWDNAAPYDGSVRSWGHRLQEAGVRVESIGKLHFRGGGANAGFAREISPMHVMDGIGQVWGAVRDPLPPTRDIRMLAEIGPGTSRYNDYDRRIADEAVEWLRGAAAADGPWALYVGFVAPHFPLVVPEEFYGLYPLDALPEPKLHPARGHARHPWIERMDAFLRTDSQLGPEERRMAVAAYLGLCTYVDSLVGEVLDALDGAGLRESTRVVYTSDHGDNVGARGLWGKSNMYEESAGIPLIARGDGFAAGAACGTPVSLVDLYPTVLDAFGLEPDAAERGLPGASLLGVAAAPRDPGRTVFSEYHATASPSAAFMVRRGDRKLIHYVGYEPELFDLSEDPEETASLAADPARAGELAELDRALRAVCDPEATDRAAKDDQNALVGRYGGPAAAFGEGTPAATPVPEGLRSR